MTTRSRLSTRLGASVAAISLSLLAVGVAAAPASAAETRTLPVGSSLYAISCESDLTNLSVFSIDVTTAAATPVGEGTPDSANCAGQAAYNPVTSVSYFVAWGVQVGGDDERLATVLATVDLSTGRSLPVGIFLAEDGPVDVDSIAIGTDGAAYAINNETLYSLNLATAQLTEIGSLGDTDGLYGFSVDPRTGTFYGINDDGEIYSINVATGAATLVTATGLGEDADYPYSLQIDSAGVFWIEADFYVEELDGYYSHLWSISPADLETSAVLSGLITATDGPFYTESLLFVPAAVVPVAPPVAQPAAVVAPAVVPQLANTGVDAAPIAAGGALVALLGLALLVPAIRRRANA